MHVRDAIRRSLAAIRKSEELLEKTKRLLKELGGELIEQSTTHRQQ